MTNHSQPNPDPTPYHAAQSRPKIIRPEAVSILAILGILVGSLLLFCDVIVMVVEANMLAHPTQSPIQGMPPLDPVQAKFGAANALGCVVFGITLLGACIAALSLRPWSRQMLLIWSIGFILLGMARTAGEILYVAPARLAWVGQHQPDNADYASGKMQRQVVPKAIGALALYCVLPGLFLFFWNRPDVIDAFDRAGGMGDGPKGEDR